MNLLLEYINRCNKNKTLLNENISSGFKYHIEKGIPLSKNIFRPDSKQFFDLFFEARIYLKEGLYNADTDEQYYLLETDIGNFDYYNGELVPLDWPIEYDYVLDEARKKRRKKRKSKSKSKKKSGSYYQGRKVTLNKPARGGSKKFYVYVRDPKTKNIKKVSFGAKGMSVGLKDPQRRKSFSARHRCPEKKDKTTAGYWACRIGRYPNLTGGKSKFTWW